MTHNSGKWSMLKLTSGILKKIKEGQKVDLGWIEWLVLINQAKDVDFTIDVNGVKRFRDIVYVPNMLELKKCIIEEGQMNGLSIHPGATKMYQYLKNFFGWLGMKKYVIEFFYSCLTCEKSKIEH